MKATWAPQMLREYNMLPNTVLQHWHAGGVVASLASHIQKMEINGIPHAVSCLAFYVDIFKSTIRFGRNFNTNSVKLLTSICSP